MATTNLPDRYLAPSLPALLDGTRLPSAALPHLEGDGVDLRYLLALSRSSPRGCSRWPSSGPIH